MRRPAPGVNREQETEEESRQEGAENHQHFQNDEDKAEGELALDGLEEADRYSTLTEREKDLLALIASGQTNKQIARALMLSEHIVHNHRAYLMEKLGLHDRMQLLKYVIRRGIVRTQD